MQPHGVVVVNEALDKSSGILLGKRAAKPEAISFEALVPAFDFPVALWVIGGGFDMGQPGQANKLRTVIGDDSRRSIRIFFPSSLQNNLDIKLRHCGAQFPMQQETRTAIQDRAKIEEGADDVQIGDIHMPVLVRLKRLLEAVTLTRRLWVPAL